MKEVSNLINEIHSDINKLRYNNMYLEFKLLIYQICLIELGIMSLIKLFIAYYS